MAHSGAKTNAVVETVDIFPTLTDLAGLTKPNFSDGQSLQKIINNPTSEGHSALSYRGKANTLRTKDYRFTLHRSGYVELYDHNSAEKETKNIADQHPELVKKLTLQLKAKLN